jgi:hypothetical protein
LSLVQEVLGHKNASMTRRYAKRTAKKIGQVLSAAGVEPASCNLTNRFNCSVFQTATKVLQILRAAEFEPMIFVLTSVTL